MIRVLHLAEGATFAGIETHILALAEAFLSHDVQLSAASFAQGELTRRLAGLGVDFTVIPRAHKLDTKPVARIASLLREADILHTHGYLADIYGRIAAKRVGAPHVATVHGHPEPFPGVAGMKMKLYMRLDRWALAGADRVIAVSRGLETRLQSAGIEPGHIRMIENGLPERRPSPEAVNRIRESNGGEPLIGFAGRFDRVKAPIRFMEIAKMMLAHCPGARFLLAGDGPLQAECRKIAEATGHAASFRFLGFCDDLDPVISACDFLVIPSDSEGVPQVLIAAMREGVVPVCSEVGGIPDVLAGFPDCVAAPDARALFEKLQALYGTPQKRRELSALLQKRFTERYTAGAMAGKVADLYREVKRK